MNNSLSNIIEQFFFIVLIIGIPYVFFQIAKKIKRINIYLSLSITILIYFILYIFYMYYLRTEFNINLKLYNYAAMILNPLALVAFFVFLGLFVVSLFKQKK